MIGEPGMDYTAGSDEFGAIRSEKASKSYKIGDKLEVIAPHCDPVVNLYDQIHGIRNDISGSDLADHGARQVSVAPRAARCHVLRAVCSRAFSCYVLRATCYVQCAHVLSVRRARGTSSVLTCFRSDVLRADVLGRADVLSVLRLGGGLRVVPDVLATHVSTQAST